MGRRVCILGAGIVGSTSAYALARAGWDVTLVDMANGAGMGTSHANGAQLSYSYVEPLATPEALRALPRWLLDPASPLKWHPRPEWAHAAWLARFVACCRPAVVQATTRSLLALSFLSRDTLHGWFADIPELEREALAFAQPGKLVLYRHPEARHHVAQQLAWQAALGCRQKLVEPDECRAIEPALAATGGGPFAFGVWTESEEVIDAWRLSELFARASEARLVFGARVTRIETRDGRIAALVTQDGDRMEADQFVIAAGPQMNALLQPLGLTLPIEPIRGFSVTLPVVRPEAAPRVSITDTGRKLVHARLGETLRVAGFAELCGWNTAINPARIEALCAAVEKTFPGACNVLETHAWAGLRPATPSGLPAVCGTRYGNLWLNGGHGSLGLTLSAGSAVLLERLMAGDATPIPAAPYRYAA